MSDFDEEDAEIQYRTFASTFFCKHGLWPHEECVKCKHDAPPQPHQEPKSWNLGNGVRVVDYPPQPPPYDGTIAYKPAQPPPGDKFEGALQNVLEFLPARDSERKPFANAVNCVRAAHAEAVEMARQAGRDEQAALGSVTFDHADRIRAAGVAEGRRAMAREALDRVGQLAAIRFCEWLEARAGEKKQ